MGGAYSGDEIPGPKLRMRLFSLGAAGQEAFGEAEDLDALTVGAFQALDHPGEVALEIAALRFQLAMADADGAVLARGRGRSPDLTPSKNGWQWFRPASA